MKRIYESVIKEHFSQWEQMAFVAGPRQVGKTTIAEDFCRTYQFCKYLNWDKTPDRAVILSGVAKMVEGLPTEAVLAQKPLLVLDEIHKYSEWKNLLKGLIDEYKKSLHILVTGSAKLNVFQKGGDSLMGRYFYYRVHPLSVAELSRTVVSKQALLSPPSQVDPGQFSALFEFGGFPEPFLKQSRQFFNQWQTLREQQVFREEIRELAQIKEIAQLEVLAHLLKHQAGQLVSYSQLAKKVRVADQTIRRWVNVLESFYYCFSLRPWTKNVARSLLKEPKLYMWDWSIIPDHGARVENFVACHLLKAVHFWNDIGLGKFGLYFLRDKEKRGVDFLLTKEEKPWILIEVKSSAKESLNKNLFLFQKQLQVPHVLQLAFDLPYVEQDCLQLMSPTIVPMQTFLSQLV